MNLLKLFGIMNHLQACQMKQDGETFLYAAKKYAVIYAILVCMLFFNEFEQRIKLQ